MQNRLTNREWVDHLMLGIWLRKVTEEHPHNNLNRLRRIVGVKLKCQDGEVNFPYKQGDHGRCLHNTNNELSLPWTTTICLFAPQQSNQEIRARSRTINRGKKTSLPTHVQNILLPIAPLPYFLTSYSILTLPGIILYTYEGISCGLAARDLWCLHKLIHRAGEDAMGFFCN
jgi:hypothetical protein